MWNQIENFLTKNQRMFILDQFGPNSKLINITKNVWKKCVIDVGMDICGKCNQNLEKYAILTPKRTEN